MLSILRRRILFVMVMINIFCLKDISAKATLVHFQYNDTLPFVGQSTRQDATFLLVTCSIRCLQNYECFAFEFDEAGNFCTLIMYHSTKAIENEIKHLYQRQRVCRLEGYQYLWEIDVCLRFVSKTYTWNDAKVNCENEGGQLVTAETMEKESMILKSLAIEYAKTNRVLWWIGGSDIEEEGSFKWINGHPFTHDNWLPGQPDDLTGDPPSEDQKDADCVAYTALKLEWLDRNNFNRHWSICENRSFL